VELRHNGRVRRSIGSLFSEAASDDDDRLVIRSERRRLVIRSEGFEALVAELLADRPEAFVDHHGRPTGEDQSIASRLRQRLLHHVLTHEANESMQVIHRVGSINCDRLKLM
jgi:hypothetical protein